MLLIRIQLLNVISTNKISHENFMTSERGNGCVQQKKQLSKRFTLTWIENFNPRITEERFQTSLINSTSVDCEEGSN